jgi:hypothetical protein
VANRPDQPLDYLIQKLSKARGKFIYVLTVTHLQPRDCSLWDPPAV